MRTLLDFKNEAYSHDICEKWKAEWDKAESSKSLMLVALNIQGIEFIAKSIAEGWGMTSDYIAERFRDYINGRYIYHADSGYTSEMFCRNDNEITVRTTNVILIDCHCVVNIPDGYLCNVYITGDDSSVVIFNNNAYCHAVRYGKADVALRGNGNTHFTIG